MADVPKPPVDNRPVYQRLLAARRNTASRAREEIMLLTWLSHLLLDKGCYVHLTPAETENNAQTERHFVVCVHSSYGQMTWKITDLEQVAWFSHLEKKKCKSDGHGRQEKLNRLEALIEQMGGQSHGR